jgi:hypothetical protein
MVSTTLSTLISQAWIERPIFKLFRRTLLEWSSSKGLPRARFAGSYGVWSIFFLGTKGTVGITWQIPIIRTQNFLQPYFSIEETFSTISWVAKGSKRKSIWKLPTTGGERKGCADGTINAAQHGSKSEEEEDWMVNIYISCKTKLLSQYLYRTQLLLFIWILFITLVYGKSIKWWCWSSKCIKIWMQSTQHLCFDVVSSALSPCQKRNFEPEGCCLSG